MSSVHRVRIGLGAALVAALVWLVVVGVPAIEEAGFRSELRASGSRFDARVAEAGFERPDGTLREVVVTGPFDNLVGVDLGESRVRVREVGDELRVVVPSTAYHRGLPEDVVDRSVAAYLLARLAAPGVVAVSLLIALVIAHRRVRSSGQHH
ncbi:MULTISPECIES: hypothetical protein [Saccharothrix]|uniref:hypothetical protein n=1 Tax=Saccharothrix TaxID=2071 RepID=UPI00093919A4|nr:hypothetical protein [Saccharothrix sp. CB00851]OKI18667.1 hypothetical protein A6A25_39655 [Saccharothrix sp. CB00851]